MQLKERGAAMLAAILFLLVASGIITLLFTSTLSEIRQTGDSVAIVQSLTLARGGANLGGRLLSSTLRNDLQTFTLRHANTVNVFPFGEGANITSEAPIPSTVIRDLEDVITDLQARADTYLCGDSNALSPSSGYTVSLRVHFTKTACGDSLPSSVKLPGARYISGSTRTYSVPYVLVSDATVGSYNRRIVSQGEYQFSLGGGKFSQYALFTDTHLSPNDGAIWFTSNTLFDGPVHTNTNHRYAFEPWFGDEVTSAGCLETRATTDAKGDPTTECVPGRENYGADFFNTGFLSATEIENGADTGASNSPDFEKGVDWRADYIALPRNAIDQRAKANESGLMLNTNLFSLNLYAADNSGNPLSSNGSGGWTPAASYQYIEACTTSATDCTLYRYGSDKKLYKATTVLDASGVVTISTWTLEQSNFNGVVYVEGEVERFGGPARTPADSSDPDTAPPALASFAQLTLVPEDGVRITRDLKYEEQPCSGTPTRTSGTVTGANCNNLNAENVLGVFVPNEDRNILIGNNNAATDPSLDAPDNVAIHASLMASQGVVTVENFGQGNATRGSINLLGGIIGERYGAFGTFNSSTGIRSTGFGRNFTFDQRLRQGFSPPYFPGTSPSVVRSVFIYSFGQREQAF